MREIKFRAWNLAKKCWISSFYPLFNGYDVFQSRHWFEGIQGDNDEDLSFTDGEAILMQYTGLKDRLQKEIFEGDILVHDLGSRGKSDPFQVIYKGCGFTIKPNHTSQMDAVALNNLHSGFEVIGNIYENPELLK